MKSAKLGDALEICDGIIFEFYPGLPHTYALCSNDTHQVNFDIHEIASVLGIMLMTSTQQGVHSSHNVTITRTKQNSPDNAC